MSVDYLECSHCGGVAIESDESGLFGDGDGGACVTCGFPGAVSADAETSAWWNESDDRDARCTDPECLECRALGEEEERDGG